MERLKRGTVREDGMVFWGYNKTCKTGQCWMTKDKFTYHMAKAAEIGKNRSKSGDYTRYREQNRDKRQLWDANRRAAKIQRTPEWSLDNLGIQFEIECIYKYCGALRAIGLDYHVDHIAPLQGETVSGLHLPWNLQVIHASENLHKSNKFE